MRLLITLMISGGIFLLSGFGLPDTPDLVEEVADEVLPEPDYDLWGIVVDASPDQWSGVAKGGLKLDVGESGVTYVRGTAEDGTWFELCDSTLTVAWEEEDELSVTLEDSCGAVRIEVLEPGMVWLDLWVMKDDSTRATNPDGEEIESATIFIQQR